MKSTLLLLVFLCSTVLTTSRKSNEAEALQISAEEWVTVSRCRIQCVEKFLLAANKPATEDVCMRDVKGCYQCWRTCEFTLTQPSKRLCDDGVRADDVTCDSGCHAACDAHSTLEKVFYATDNKADLIREPSLRFLNTTAVHMTLDDDVTGTFVAVVLYRMGGVGPWAQLMSTFQQPISVLGTFRRYPGLLLRLLTLTSQGVIGDAEIDIFTLASAVTDPSSTTTTPSPPTTQHENNNPDPMTTTAQPLPTTPDSYYQRMFNHFFLDQLNDKLLQSVHADTAASQPMPVSNSASHSVLYITVAVVCILVLVVIVVGIVVLRSNNQLAKTLSSRARSFRSSVRRSVRGMRRGGARGRYDVEGVMVTTSLQQTASDVDSGNDSAATAAENAMSDAIAATEMQPMVVPLLCVSTPNLNATKLLNVSSLHLPAKSLSSSLLPRDMTSPKSSSDEEKEPIRTSRDTNTSGTDAPSEMDTLMCNESMP